MKITAEPSASNPIDPFSPTVAKNGRAFLINEKHQLFSISNTPKLWWNLPHRLLIIQPVSNCANHSQRL